MSELKEKINQRMDILQNWMEKNYHLKRPEVVSSHIESVSKFLRSLKLFIMING